jgi:hypothetical protein
MNYLQQRGVVLTVFMLAQVQFGLRVILRLSDGIGL